MKSLFVVAILTITLGSTFAAPGYDYNNPTYSGKPQHSGHVAKPSITFQKANVYETSVNPLQGKNYNFVKADCQNLGDDVERIGNRDVKIHKIGCVYPGDGPIKPELLQAINEHFRTNVLQHAA